MTAPKFVPGRSSDEVRPDDRLPPAGSWVADRPGEISSVFQPAGSQLGVQGPDQGYALKLVNGFKGRLQLTEGEHEADAIAGCLAVALKRASSFGRAPVVHDFTHAFTLWGFLGNAPADLIEYRKGLFSVASHHYEDQRLIADAVPESTVKKTPDQIANEIKGWRSLIAAS